MINVSLWLAWDDVHFHWPRLSVCERIEARSIIRRYGEPIEAATAAGYQGA
jgi:hypothetical protein